MVEMCMPFGVAMVGGFIFGKCICNKLFVSVNTTPMVSGGCIVKE